MTAAASVSLWPGPFVHEGAAGFKRAREAGLSPLRAMAIGVVGSFKDGWLFRRKIAEWLGCSVRTVGRAFEQGRREGVLRTARMKPNEVPPGARGPIVCGASHRWLPGWGEAGKAIGVAVARAKARFMARALVNRKNGPNPLQPPARSKVQLKRWTAAELDAELERQAQRMPPRPPDKPPD